MKSFLKVLFTLLVSVILTIAGSLFYFNVRPESKLLVFLPDEVPTTDSDAFSRLLEVYLGHPFTEGNDIIHFKNGEEIFPAKLEAIASSEHSINLEVYEFWGEKVAGKITDALIERAENGVAVRVLLDFFGSMDADPTKFERMEKAGIDLIRWREASWYHSGRFNNRTHRKLLIIDGRTAFTGGANMGDDWWSFDDDGLPTYRENHYQFTGPIVHQIQAAFMDNWLRAANEVLVGDAYFPEPESTGNKRMQVVISSPSDGQKRIRTFLILAFGAARESISIQTAFFYPDSVLKQALKDAVDRGVEVKIIAPGPPTQNSLGSNIVRQASRNRWGPLLENGVRIFEYQPTMIHSKLFIVDDHLVSVGSVNFDNRSFRINDEANVNILCTSFGEHMRMVFDADLADSKEYTLEMWKSRPILGRVKGFIGNAVGPQL